MTNFSKNTLKNLEAIKSGKSEAELLRYFEQTEEIRRLSAPHIRDIDGADSYRETLLENYRRIGELAKDNAVILSSYFYPMLETERKLTSEEIRIMRFFSSTLNNASNLINMDIPLIYRQAKRLLEDAECKQDDNMRILALDEVVSTSYIMICMTERLLPVNDSAVRYKEFGLEAGEKLLKYLDKDKFVTLSDESKELIVINARYLRVVSMVDGMMDTPESNALIIERMKNALAIADDPFYREQLPNYDWDMHVYRTLEYIGTLSDYNNAKGFTKEELEFINTSAERIQELYYSDDSVYSNADNTNETRLIIYRNAYLTGKISLQEYKDKLREMSLEDHRETLDDNVSPAMVHTPLEYLLLIDSDNIEEEDRFFLLQLYGLLITYMHQTPKMGKITFLLSYMFSILKHFIEIPGGISFEHVGINLIAALHPPTYVHTLCVADFTKCLTNHLLKRSPELFIGMPGINSADDAKNNADKIIDFAYHAALCHDFGKLSIIETIITYGRDLLDGERRFITVHPSVGAYLLSLVPTTSEYADIARGHHKWFDNTAGYPEDFDLDASPYKTIISIVTCADCLDAATDSVGRSYKKGKSLEELIDEFREGRGTRYAPYVVDLFSDKDILSEVSDILETKRDINYREAYNVLKEYDNK